MKEKHLEGHHHAIDKLIIVSSFISGVSLLPEVFKVIHSHTVNAMSGVTLFIILINSIVWLLYGIHCKLKSLFISSILTILSSGFLLIAQCLY